VVIAILDTGLKTAGLSDFDGQVLTGWNVLSNSSNTTSQAGNHGTYVAGAAGLALDNGIGSAGFCPGCRIMPVQVGTDSGAYLSDLATGLTWAADHGARVANMSWAGTSTSSTLQSAINYAHSKGLVLTAAAGNSNCDCKTYPAASSGVLAVGGTDNTGNKAGDSNYGSWVTLAAPEGNLTAWPTINGSPGYAPVGGTSLAAPVVAGIAGLLFSYNGSLTNTQVEQALEATAASVPFTVQYGRVDALAALQYLGATDPQSAAAPVQTSTAQIYYELNGASSIAPLTAAPQPGQVLVRGVGGWTGSAGLAVAGLQWQRCDGGGLNCIALTSASTYTVQSADVGYTLKLVFSVKNALGSVSRAVLTWPVGGSTPPVSPPTNTSPPTISGNPQDRQTLAGSTGSWSGSPTAYGYQWQRCDSAGSGCAAITGARGSSYLVQAADVGSTVRVAVPASNSAGSGAAVSAATAVVASAPAAPPPTTTVTFSGSLNGKSPSRSYSFKVGAGLADARLSFSKCSSLALALSNGARTSGPSVVVLDQTLAAGTYAYTISGGRCSFTLTVTAPSP
jgi:Subtilase family